jgi:hypothetical protein
MIRYFIVILALFLFFPILSFAEQDKWSFSVGQFDVNDDDENDNNDSSEIRFEYLSGKNLFGDMELKPFTGLMVNGDDGKYLYSGLRKDFTISSKWIFTPSFAAGYYDRDSSKDLGYNLEFRSQIEFSREIGNQNRLGFNLNHISNASVGNTNPGVESATISIIRSF